MKVLSRIFVILMTVSQLFGCSGGSKGRSSFKTQPKPPIVTNVTSPTANGGYDLLSTIIIQVGFNDVVNVTGTPTLTLETGTTDRVVNYSSGSGSATLVFSYIVQAGDVAADLNYVSETALQLAGGTINSSSSNLAANLTLPDIGEANSLGINKNIVVGSVWNFIDGNQESTGMNFDSGGAANRPKLVEFDSQLYAFWDENSQIRAKRFTGTNWVSVDGGATVGLNKSSSWPAQSAQPVVFSEELYAVWSEENGTANQIRAAMYTGTAWTFVDGDNALTGLNFNTTLGAVVPSAAVYGSNLYLAWEEANAGAVGQIRVKMYNGATWAFVDGNGANGLNRNVLQAATAPKLVVYGSNLYAAWIEGNPAQIRVSRYNGTSWAFVDGDAVNGLNRDTSRIASEPSLVVFDGELYLSWSEEDSSGVRQMRVRRYDADSWIFVDGNEVEGLNKDSGLDAFSSSFVVHNSALYLSWSEGNPAQIRVAKYSNAQWVFVDGDDVDGINRVSTNSATMSSIVSFNSRIHSAWTEFSPLGNIRVARYQ